MIITDNDHSGIQQLKLFLRTQFEMKDLVPLRYFLGTEAAYFPNGLLVTQQNYVHDILSRAAVTDTKLVSTPLDANAKLGITDGTLLFDSTR